LPSRSGRPDTSAEYSEFVSAARDLGPLEEVLGHRFSSRALLEQAVAHRSWANEQKGGAGPDNEKLEFLGDAVLALAVGHQLIETYTRRAGWSPGCSAG
jgi:dsRNA-specific ribonuclease